MRIWDIEICSQFQVSLKMAELCYSMMNSSFLHIRDAEKGKIIPRTNSFTKQKTQLTLTLKKKKDLCTSLCLYVSHGHTLPSLSAYVHVSLGVYTQLMLTCRDQNELHVLLSCPDIPDSWSSSKLGAHIFSVSW